MEKKINIRANMNFIIDESQLEKLKDKSEIENDVKELLKNYFIDDRIISENYVVNCKIKNNQDNKK